MPLTDAKLRTLKPKDKPYKVADFQGLYVTVTPAGSCLWHLKYRVDGREKRLSFGMYPEVGLAEARRKRDAARMVLARGEDPGEVKKEAKRAAAVRDAETFAKQAKIYKAKIAAENKAPSTRDKAEWLLDMAIAEFGDRPISQITAPVVLQCLRKVEAKGNYETAKRLRSKIGAVFRLAIATGLAETDPTYPLRDALIRPQVKPRAAITDPKRLGELLRAIEEFHGQAVTRIGLQLLALLVPRPGELRQARWEEFDLDAAIWTIPAERMKMRRPHRVPLPQQAIELLRDLSLLTGSGKLVLPSLVSSIRPMSENTLNMALRRLGFGADEMTSHGFRATFSTIANESGRWHPDAIERALAHVEGNAVRRAYARGEHWDERVRMAEWWAGFLEEARANSG